MKEVIDYSELSWKMDKYMPDDEGLQNEFHGILYGEYEDEERLKLLIEFFQLYADGDEMETYMPECGNIQGFCQSLIDTHP